MCGFSKETLPDVDAESFLQQFESAYNIADKEFLVKIYVSGSFFNHMEVPVEVRDSILETLSHDERVMKVTVESRPEFLNEETLKAVPGRDKLEVAIGLETADDHVRSRCINKGFTFKDYLQSVEIAGKSGLKVKTYLLLKPPHLTEKEAIEDAVGSARMIPPESQTLSLNPSTVHRHTKVEDMWRDNLYRPPWIWSVIEVALEVKRMDARPLFIDTSGFKTSRGPRNCGKCDHYLTKRVKKFSATQDVSLLEGLDCNCKNTWEETLELEKWVIGAPLPIPKIPKGI